MAESIQRRLAIEDAVVIALLRRELESLDLEVPVHQLGLTNLALPESGAQTAGRESGRTRRASAPRSE